MWKNGYAPCDTSQCVKSKWTKSVHHMRIFTRVVPQLLVMFRSTTLQQMHSSADENNLTKAHKHFCNTRRGGETSHGICHWFLIHFLDPGWWRLIVTSSSPGSDDSVDVPFWPASLTSVFSTFLLLSALTSLQFRNQKRTQSEVQKDYTCLTHWASPAYSLRTSFITLTYHLGRG